MKVFGTQKIKCYVFLFLFLLVNLEILEKPFEIFKKTFDQKN